MIHRRIDTVKLSASGSPFGSESHLKVTNFSNQQNPDQSGFVYRCWVIDSRSSSKPLRKLKVPLSTSILNSIKRFTRVPVVFQFRILKVNPGFYQVHVHGVQVSTTRFVKIVWMCEQRSVSMPDDLMVAHWVRSRSRGSSRTEKSECAHSAGDNTKSFRS